MKSWEFLIQKEGDRQWVPISTPTLELETDVYRIMAKSHRINSDLEVRITHHPPTDEHSSDDPQNYSRHINQQGLVMILPFTELSVGIWKIRCCSDVMSEFLGQKWQETLEIQVLAPTLNSSSPDDQIKSSRNVNHSLSKEEEKKNLSQLDDHDQGEQLPTPYNSFCNNKAQLYLNQLDQLIQQKVEPLIINNNGIIFQENTDYFVKLSPSEEIIAPTLQLILNSQTFQGFPGESVTLSGRIEVQDTDEELLLTAQVCYQLKHPQTEEILYQSKSPLADVRLPHRFNQTLEIPNQLEGQKYLLGEVLLETITGIAITYYPFKIYSSKYYPVSYTIELFNTEYQSSCKIDLEVTKKTEPLSTPIELPTASKSRHLSTSLKTQSPQILPPKLKRNSTTPKSDKKSLQLPQVIID